MTVGMTIASMIASELRRMIFSAAPIGPCGSSMSALQPARTRDVARRATRPQCFEICAIITPALLSGFEVRLSSRNPKHGGDGDVVGGRNRQALEETIKRGGK